MIYSFPENIWKLLKNKLGYSFIRSFPGYKRKEWTSSKCPWISSLKRASFLLLHCQRCICYQTRKCLKPAFDLSFILWNFFYSCCCGSKHVFSKFFKHIRISENECHRILWRAIRCFGKRINRNTILSFKIVSVSRMGCVEPRFEKTDCKEFFFSHENS